MSSTAAPEHETPTASTELIGTAYHEAGHAVVNVVLRLSFTYASIVPDEEEGSLGHVHGARMSKNLVERIICGTLTLRDREHLESRIISLLAGPESERRYLGDEAAEAGAALDYRNALTYGERISCEPDELSAYMEWLRLRAVNLLRIPWNWLAVERVAAELLKHKVVRSKRIRQFVRQAKDDCFEQLREESKIRSEDHS
jgi:hypothetical protein